MYRRAGRRVLAVTVASVAAFFALAVTAAAPASATDGPGPGPSMKCPLIPRPNFDICK